MALEFVELKKINDTRVIRVGPAGATHGFQGAAQVWVSDDGRCRCTQCSGALVAMLTTCKHARAVKRWLERQPLTTHEQQ